MTGEGDLVAGELRTVPGLRCYLTFDRPLNLWTVSQSPHPSIYPTALWTKPVSPNWFILRHRFFRGSSFMSAFCHPDLLLGGQVHAEEERLGLLRLRHDIWQK